MTTIFNFALKIKVVVGRVAEAKSSNPATPPKLKRALPPPPKKKKKLDHTHTNTVTVVVVQW